MAVTLHDIAESAGVSVSTVSRVLNNKGGAYRISSATRDRVLRKARELNYRPNHLARGLRLKKTNTIGLIAPDISNPFFAYIIKRVQNLVHDLGYSLIVCNTDESLEQEIEHINLLYRKRVDGLIAMPVGLSDEHYRDWIDKGLPLVLLDRCFDSLPVDSVVVDNFRGSYDAVTHLIDQGHVRIGLIQGLPGTYTTTERLRGYLKAFEDRGLTPDRSLIVGGDFRQHNGFIETKILLGQEPRPTAVFATSDLITLGALQAIYEEGLDIPDDVSLVAFDDVEFAEYLKSPLTAVRQPRETMGELGVKLLLEQLNRTERSGQRVVLRPQLVERASVATLTKPE